MTDRRTAPPDSPDAPCPTVHAAAAAPEGRHRHRRRALAAGAAAALIATGLTGLVGGSAGAAQPAAAAAPGTPASALTADPDSPAWVGSWATAVYEAGTQEPAASGFEKQTLRQVTHLSIGGDQVRVRLTNAFGTQDLVVGTTSVARHARAGGAATAGAPTRLTFNGKESVTIPPGAEAVSDPLAMTVPDDSDLVISTYLPQATGPATYRSSGWSTSYAADGDATRATGASRYEAIGASFYFLDGVDVYTRSSGAVVTFGDSITEGCCSASFVDQNVRYPDFLADRLTAQPQALKMGVLNAGISGNRLLADGAGANAMARFERDVLGQTGVRSVILLEGINDIGVTGGSLDPSQLIGVYRQFITRAHDAGLTVVGATLTPYKGAGYYSAAGERDRQAVNAWIRTSGEFDAVVDFDRVIRDPQDAARMLPVYDPGDHLHPNAAGYAAMGAAVRLAVLR
ncbi:lysophospholipase L1-like esterase [Terracoccus luteus]|uniref:Lysophospholipase L1-like esterase n=1 Tax=Terracoccus luteus TaxID=53356 RepID=A0A495XV60_9MICO|nr:SGNH/GDSL hydrolase family protein [Terracoccus luteus]RKT77842.1 lysophospholipase L1-like esterase [Terracoccus luteus]